MEIIKDGVPIGITEAEKAFREYLSGGVGFAERDALNVSRKASKILRILDSRSLAPTYGNACSVADEIGDAGSLLRASVNAYKCAFRHFLDFLAGRPFAILARKEVPSVPEAFSESYSAYCEDAERRNAGATAAFKKAFASSFFNWASENGVANPGSLELEHYLGYARGRSSGDDWGLLRSMARFLYLEGVAACDFTPLIVGPKTRKRIPSVYTDAEIGAAFAKCKERPQAERDICIFLLAKELGLRPSDIAGLRVDSVDFASKRISIRQAKTGEPLSLPLTEELVAVMAKYLASGRKAADPSLVFASSKAPFRPISASAASRVVAESFAAAGIDPRGRYMSPRALRSTLASGLVNSGVPYPVVRKVLGHRDPDTITHYARIDVEGLRRFAIEPLPLCGDACAFFGGESHD